MLTLRATLEPDGRINLSEMVQHNEPLPVLITFLDEPAVPKRVHGNAEATLALLNSSTFQALPKGDPQEIAERIASLRNDWND